MRDPTFNDKEDIWLKKDFDEFLNYIDENATFKDKIMKGLFLNKTVFADQIVIRNKLTKVNTKHTHM